ncbi:hypothetical protein [Streptomyces longwoodensis]|uniref:hypothetical protein n=1 Tax=Streptomyces longwoodensis TaxID=68231 RepID=UPI0030E10F2C
MTSTPSSTAPDATFHEWTPAWSPDRTDPALPPITLITDPHDHPAYTTTAIAAHHPELGRITVHPTPLATAPAYLAHDLIRALGKHLPPPDIDPPWWTGNADESWRVAAAWTKALNISHYVICRAHRITGRHLEHLMALRELTRIRLTLVVSGPTPTALATILKAAAHHQVNTLEDARRHLNQGPSLLAPASYSWWRSAPFPAPHDEPWYELPPRPRRPAGTPGDITASSHRTPTRLPSTDSRPHAIALPSHTHPDTQSPHHETVAQRIHTRIAHPVHAAAVAIRALTGYSTDQLPQLTIATPQHPRGHLPTDLPDWARLLQDAARIHTGLKAHIRQDLPAHLSGANKPFQLGSWDRNDVAHATEECHLVAARVRRARQV